MKTWFLDFWREREEVLKRTNQLRLRPLQLKRLLGDSSVRTELQNARLASLLPPVGTEVFRSFTPASLQDIKQRHEAKETERQKRTNKDVRNVEKELHKQATHLEAGKPLPYILGDPPPELLNCPLEELDPFYQSQKTFIVLSEGNVLHRFNAESSCFLLCPFSCLRTVAIRILLHSLFRLFIMVTILTNCGFMMMSGRPTWSRTAEFVFSAVYMFEVLIKIMSRGFCVGRFTFLRDPWNWLDIVVVITAFLPEFLDLEKVSVLRTIPRALKIIAVYPGVKSSAGALVQSVKRLAGVIITTVLVISVLAVIGQHFFFGALRHKCVWMLSHSNWTYNDLISYHDNGTDSSDFDFHKFINSHENQYYLSGHRDPLQCGNGSDAGACPPGYICLRTDTNPDYGLTNFDWFGSSLLSLFRLMTHDTWDYLLEQMMRSAGKFSAIFVLFVFCGGFCLLILVLAGVARALVEQEKAGVAEARRTEEEFLHILDVMKKKEEEEEEEPQDDQRLSPPCCLSVWTWNCCGCWRWLKLRLNGFVMNPFFDLVIVICLILNCILMAMEHYPMTMEFEYLFNVTSLVFTGIFAVEMLLRLVAMNPYGYFRVGWNVFDSIIVALSLVELGLADIEGVSGAGVDLMRVLRLARWWSTFHMLMKIIWTSVLALRNLTLILLTMVFIFTIVGMQLFQDDYTDHVCRIAADCQLPRWHMNNLFQAFVLIFRIFCGEWIESMWDCMEVSSPSVCLIFFIMVLVIGHLLVLNLFLVLLLSLVGDDLVAPKEKIKNNPMIAVDQIKTGVAWTRTWILEHIWTLVGKKNPIIPPHKVVNSKEDNKKDYLGLTSVTSDQPLSESKALGSNHGNQTSKYTFQRVPVAEVELDMPGKEEEEQKQDEENKTPRNNTPEDCCCDSTDTHTQTHRHTHAQTHTLISLSVPGCYRCCPFLDIDTSQGSGRVWSNFRRVCFSITQHKYFDAFIIFIILLSSAALVLEDVHLQQRQLVQMLLDKADQVFTFIFLLEMLLKWIALGFRKYFTSVWCWLDFLILSVSLMSLTLGMLGYSELGAGLSLRTLRALRPLRALSRFQGLRLVLNTLGATFPSMCDVMLVCLLVWLIFSVLGVNLFAGKFYHCFNATEQFLPEEVNNKSDCLSLIHENFSDVSWKNKKLHFDNVAEGYRSLLQVATFNGWLEVISSAVDARQIESQPVYESNVYMYVYFISFIIIGCFFTSNLFIRLFIKSLDQLRHKFGGKHFFMTDEQQNFSISVKKLFSTKRPSVPRPHNQCQARLFDLVTKHSFEVVMVIVICLNTVTLMVETDEQSQEKEIILEGIYFVFIIIFLTEFLLKIIALRHHYFCDCLNVLDFVVIFISIMGLLLSDIMQFYFIHPKIFTLLRLARITRIIHLVPYTRGIRRLFLAFVMSLPALFNICLLLFLLMFTFSVFGMLSFAHARMNDMFNFETFLNSMICMFTITTMVGWDHVLSPILNTPPDCDPDSGDCVHPTVGIIFFTSYITLSLLLVVLLYTAVVMETLNMYDTETPSDKDLQMFYKTWRRFDPDTSQIIPYSQLSDFCDALQDPLRIPKPNTIKLIHMDLPLLPGDKIHCVDVLSALTARISGDGGQTHTLTARMEERFTINNVSKMSYEPISSTLQRKQEEVAAAVIQKAYRKHLLKDRAADEMTAEPAGGAAAV
ncbi:sodium channel protein type 4 subunit alpha B-like isoform X2 [Hippoglossus hippoglossus]|uniref:sodium channel protein type 4 subunit alpha B-like isoform X2 n=1 Tax=Hippoglossus hippoglossus TaxID=8267 RepID=UPI00148DB3BA|nr:sodium channel protein type 4 subunit alpha B-like isoform X2 [Hippoglossus hippoglossus]